MDIVAVLKEKAFKQETTAVEIKDEVTVKKGNSMKHLYNTGMSVCVTLAMLMLVPTTAMAWRYCPGSLGVAGSIAPPPGFYYIMYNSSYHADTINDSGGNASDVGLDLNVFANVHQFVYITQKTFLKGYFGFDTTIPLIHTDLQIEAYGIDSDDFGLGDICIEPFSLSWHYPRFDAVIGLALYMPTGNNDTPSSPGQDYYSMMETLGINVYLDKERTWSAAVMTRWVQNTENDDTGITQGDEFVAEYGIGKTVKPSTGLFFRAGLAGYSAVQLTEDSGNRANSNERRKIHALGPDINFTWLGPLLFQLEARYMFEYAGESYTEGQLLTITFRARY